MYISNPCNMKALRYLCILVILCCVVCGCQYIPDDFPDNKNSEWYCESLDFGFRYHYNEAGQLKGSSVDSLCWAGEEYSVGIAFGAASWVIYLENGDAVVEIEEQILSGRWYYRSGDLILEIGEDHLFGGAVTQLVFSPIGADPDGR